MFDTRLTSPATIMIIGPTSSGDLLLSFILNKKNKKQASSLIPHPSAWGDSGINLDLLAANIISSNSVIIASASDDSGIRLVLLAAKSSQIN